MAQRSGEIGIREEQWAMLERGSAYITTIQVQTEVRSVSDDDSDDDDSDDSDEVAE